MHSFWHMIIVLCCLICCNDSISACIMYLWLTIQTCYTVTNLCYKCVGLGPPCCYWYALFNQKHIQSVLCLIWHYCPQQMVLLSLFTIQHKLIHWWRELTLTWLAPFIFTDAWEEAMPISLLSDFKLKHASQHYHERSGIVCCGWSNTRSFLCQLVLLIH